MVGTNLRRGDSMTPNAKDGLTTSSDELPISGESQGTRGVRPRVAMETPSRTHVLSEAGSICGEAYWGAKW